VVLFPCCRGDTGALRGKVTCLQTCIQIQICPDPKDCAPSTMPHCLLLDEKQPFVINQRIVSPPLSLSISLNSKRQKGELV